MRNQLLSLTFLALAAFAAPVAAQPIPQCDTETKMADDLLSKYGELPLFHFVGSNDLVKTFYGNPETQTWTVLITDANQLSCIIDFGTGFAVADHILEGEAT